VISGRLQNQYDSFKDLKATGRQALTEAAAIYLGTRTALLIPMQSKGL
jgi:hypothetical protein